MGRPFIEQRYDVFSSGLFRYSLLAFVVSCGGSPATDPSLPEPSAPSPVQAVHEWGLVSVTALGIELAAGPGQQEPSPMEMMTVDKPVLYVHASAPTSLHVEVGLAEGMILAEHFPPSSADALTWDVEVTPGECTAPRDYAGTCNSTDGYCETRELALYETSDAACLTQGELSLPLLFYRLRAGTPPEMPLLVERGSNNDVSVLNIGLEAGASIWRVTWDGTQAHATRALAPAAGERIVIPRTLEGGVVEVRAAMRQDLANQGLTSDEAEAFMRAWDVALFGAAGSIVDEDVADLPPADETPTNSPVAIDELVVDGLVADNRVITGAPRITDTILYWLPAANIESMAELTFRPAPQEVNRAILVRVDAR